MSPGNSSGCSFGQHMVDQTPRFDNQVRKGRRRGRRENQVQGKKLIRPDKRFKAKYL
jgi:hypothetical protein